MHRYVGFELDGLDFWSLDLRKGFIGYLIVVPGDEGRYLNSGCDEYYIRNWRLDRYKIEFDLQRLGRTNEESKLSGRVVWGAPNPRLDLELSGMTRDWKRNVVLRPSELTVQNIDRANRVLLKLRVSELNKAFPLAL